MNGCCMYGLLKVRGCNEEHKLDHARNFPQRLRSAWHSPHVLVYISPLHTTFLFGTSRYLCWFKSKMPTKHQSSRYQKHGTGHGSATSLDDGFFLRYSGTSMGTNSTRLWGGVTWWILSKTGSGTPPLFSKMFGKIFFSLFLGGKLASLCRIFSDFTCWSWTTFCWLSEFVTRLLVEWIHCFQNHGSAEDDPIAKETNPVLEKPMFHWIISIWWRDMRSIQYTCGTKFKTNM